MKIYHLSHTDLDGYACQFIVNFYFKNVKFYNSNYGKEINENFNSIIGDIEKDENFDFSETPMEELIGTAAAHCRTIPIMPE